MMSGVARIGLVGRKGEAWDVPLLEFHWELLSEKVPANPDPDPDPDPNPNPQL
jgi:hypothetical protein